MCFMLYAGTDRPLARRVWDKDEPAKLGVSPLDEKEEPVRRHFGKAEVQNVGSTVGCGCDFPSIMENNGEWPWWDGCLEPDQVESEQFNRELLAKLLRASGEKRVELYGIWWGDFVDAPLRFEEVSLRDLLEASFRFKEGCFYRVDLEDAG